MGGGIFKCKHPNQNEHNFYLQLIVCIEPIIAPGKRSI
jgi:hypothetical protein